MSENKLLLGLNEMQKNAVLTIDGPLLLLAGAGSGKTKVLTHRIAYLIENGVSPYNILAITFTNKAAKEMKERASTVSDQGQYVWVSTFHSTCVRILRQEIEHISYGKNFTIYDPDDCTKLIKECMKALEINDKQYPVKSVINKIGSQKDELISPKEYEELTASNFYEFEISKIYTLYQKKLAENNALDFDDIIYKTVELFTKNPKVLEKYQDRFTYIMIDEYQDTNTSQYELIRLLSKKNKNICVVGDDDQSIYGWRGANIRNILDFEKDFPGAKVIKLEENYRSTKNILTAANQVIKNNKTRKDKSLFTSKEEGDKIYFYKAPTDFEESLFITETIIKEVEAGKSYKDFAILYRTNGQSRSIEDKLVKNNVPYRLFGGVRFYERREIKDLLAYLKLIHNTYDEIYLKRIINVPRRGIGEGTIEKLVNYSFDAGISLFEALCQVQNISGLGNRSKNLEEFANVLQELAELSITANVSELLSAIIEKINYMDYVNLEGEEEAIKRKDNISELISKAAEFTLISEDKSLSAFLEEVSLVADIDNYKDDDDAVVLMTLHSSKGLEFPTVFMAGFEDGVFPSYRSLDSGENKEIEEERRLCYVGITRAKERLFITSATSRMSFGNVNKNPVSRFFKEIPVELFDEVYVPQKVESFEGYMDFHHANNANSYKDSINRAKTYMTQNKILPKDKPIDFVVGDKVRQMKYGVGEVLEINPAGADYEVTVSFSSHGVKKFMAHLSKLKKV